MSVDCLSYLIKHMLTNEEAKFFFAVPVTLYISLGCVRTKVYVAKAHPTNKMARFRFQEKKLCFPERLEELLDFVFSDVLRLFI